jgi:hypothetical protein
LLEVDIFDEFTKTAKSNTKIFVRSENGDYTLEKTKKSVRKKTSNNSGKPISKMNKKELTEYANSLRVEIDSKDTKNDILEKINKKFEETD